MAKDGFTLNLEGSKTLRRTLAAYYEAIEKPHCDKYGLGFNLDSRFSAVKLTLSLDSWTGYYGDSSCSTAVHVGESGKQFESALLLVLNQMLPELLEKVIKEMEDKARKDVKLKIEEAERKLSELQSFMEAQGESNGQV